MLKSHPITPGEHALGGCVLLSVDASLVEYEFTCYDLARRSVSREAYPIITLPSAPKAPDGARVRLTFAGADELVPGRGVLVIVEGQSAGMEPIVENTPRTRGQGRGHFTWKFPRRKTLGYKPIEAPLFSYQAGQEARLSVVELQWSAAAGWTVRAPAPEAAPPGLPVSEKKKRAPSAAHA